MKIEFLGHAGFAIDCNEKTILIDPWLTPSDLVNPFVESLIPPHKSIDYLIPEAVRARDELHPDIILISHFHAHHSPRQDICFWLENAKKKILLIGPKDRTGQVAVVFKNLKEQYPQHEFCSYENDFERHFDQFSIQGLTHPCVHHFSYFIKSFQGSSFLHIADAKINRRDWDRRLDMLWFKYRKLNPSFLALSAGSGSMRMENENGKFIVENVFMSPVEAAQLTSEIAPQLCAIMGIYNFSVWKNRKEYFYSSSETEEYFSWAVKHINSGANTLALRPGMVVSINENKIGLNFLGY